MNPINFHFKKADIVHFSKIRKFHHWIFFGFKLYIITAFLFFQSVNSFAQQQEVTTLFFDNDKHHLNQKSKDKIDQLFSDLMSKDIFQIVVTGHTDNRGSEVYNESLAMARAEQVQEYMIDRGFSSNVLGVKSDGERQPMASNDQLTGRQRNRRVVIRIFYNEKEEDFVSYKKVAEPKLEKRSIVKEDILLDEMLEETNKKEVVVPQKPYSLNRDFLQFFKVDAKHEIVIEARQGTKVFIPKDVLIDKNGNTIFGDVTVELIEIYSKSDMILNKLQTASGQRLLESGGMIYVKVFSNDEELSIKDGSSMSIEFPTEVFKKGMSIFYGQEERSNINWVSPSRVTESLTVNFQSDLGDGVLSRRNVEIDKYILESTKFGWINCDRFINRPTTQLTNLAVNSSDTLEVNFYLVFRSINSVLSISTYKDQFIFYNVPIGEKVTLVALKKYDQEILYAAKTFEIKKNQPMSIELEKVSELALQKRLKLLDQIKS